MTVPFSNLGLALLCDNANDAKSREILQVLTQQPSFVPEATDFESVLKVCRGSGRTLFMKIMVQSYNMQFIFSSYPLDAQKRIVRLLLGFTHEIDAENGEIFPMFDEKFTLSRPYHLFVLHEIIENQYHSQIKDIMQKLNQGLSSEQLLLASLLDKTFLPKVVQLDEQLQQMDSEDDPEID